MEFTCNCGKTFNSQRSLNSHARFCEKYIKKCNKKSKYFNGNEYICECGFKTTNYQSLNGHFSYCKFHIEILGKPLERHKIPRHSMCWESKTAEEINEIHKKAGKTYSENIRKGLVKTSFKGKTHTEETKEKIRKSTIEYIKKKNNGKFGQRYNPNSIAYIENLNKLNNWHLKHALNGGEYSIGGYFVDGYDETLNIVFEYDERTHYKNIEKSILKDKDINRQNFIINKLKCKFYRYNEALDYFYQVN